MQDRDKKSYSLLIEQLLHQGKPQTKRITSPTGRVYLVETVFFIESMPSPAKAKNLGLPLVLPPANTSVISRTGRIFQVDSFTPPATFCNRGTQMHAEWVKRQPIEIKRANLSNPITPEASPTIYPPLKRFAPIICRKSPLLLSPPIQSNLAGSSKRIYASLPPMPVETNRPVVCERIPSQVKIVKSAQGKVFLVDDVKLAPLTRNTVGVLFANNLKITPGFFKTAPLPSATNSNQRTKHCSTSLLLL